jgi:hypothetical protein
MSHTAIAILALLAAQGSKPDPRDFWSLRPPRDPAPPEVRDAAWAQNPIDRFIRARLEADGIAPGPPADRRALIRRAAFDLTGLPPSPEEVEAFVADAAPDAFAKLVDRLLASPRYGERWGRHWLDVARYADTAGDDSDYPIPEAYLYRDWVIDAFNRDLPYDQFIREQLAGDLLAEQAPDERYADRIVATGFVALAKRFGTHKHEDMHLVIEDTIHTVGRAFLGMTLRCARCHDHKYDPITMRDYYALYGFFQSVVYPHAGSEEEPRPSESIPLVPSAELERRDAAWLAEHGEKLETLRAALREVEQQDETGRKIEPLRQEIEKLKASTDRQARRTLREKEKELRGLEKAVAERTKPAREALEALDRERPSRKAPRGYALKEGTVTDARIQAGGDPQRAGAQVPRGVPKVLDPDGAFRVTTETSGRLELADWIARAGNPLTARVMVNRIWQHHFGRGIVPTPSDFGTQGDPPTHPELLDWLAARFVESGWSIKAMHRRIMNSRAYQTASAADGMGGAPSRYARFERRRLAAEELRDAMLWVSGRLNLERPGAHPFPSSEGWKFTAHHQFKAVYPSDHRSVFLMTQRLHFHPYLSIFNGADTNESTAVRDGSTVPLQALFVANSPFVHEQAMGLGRRVMTEAPEARPARLYALAYGRAPTPAEAERAREYVKQYAALLEREGKSGDEEAWASLARVVLMSNEFIYVE